MKTYIAISTALVLIISLTLMSLRILPPIYFWIIAAISFFVSKKLKDF